MGGEDGLVELLAALRAEVVSGAVAVVAAWTEIHQGAAVDAVDVVGLVGAMAVGAGVQWHRWLMLDSGWLLRRLCSDICGLPDGRRMNRLFKGERHLVRALVTSLRLLL